MGSKNETNKKPAVNADADREIVISRLINAPRELVFKVWTDPDHIAKWWGPEGFTSIVHEMDVRTGGVLRMDMKGPDAVIYPNLSRYSKVIKPELLVYTLGSGMENDQYEFDVTVTFEAKGTKTLLTMRSVFKSADARDYVIREFGALEGGNQTLNRLEEHLYIMDSQRSIPGAHVFSLTRSFDAPTELVFQTFSDAKHLAKWWGPKGFDIRVYKFDFRPGGIFHYSMRSPDGNLTWGKFVLREIVAPTHLVFINSFADEKGNTIPPPFEDNWPTKLLIVITLEDRAGKTQLELRVSPIQATENEYGVFEKEFLSMQEGFGGTFDQLVEHLKHLLND